MGHNFLVLLMHWCVCAFSFRFQNWLFINRLRYNITTPQNVDIKHLVIWTHRVCTLFIRLLTFCFGFTHPLYIFGCSCSMFSCVVRSVTGQLFIYPVAWYFLLFYIFNSSKIVFIVTTWHVCRHSIFRVSVRHHANSLPCCMCICS